MNVSEEVTTEFRASLEADVEAWVAELEKELAKEEVQKQDLPLSVQSTSAERLFHGTSQEAWENEIQNEGLKPRRGENTEATDGDRAIYFTSATPIAATYAMADGKPGVILELDLRYPAVAGIQFGQGP